MGGTRRRRSGRTRKKKRLQDDFMFSSLTHLLGRHDGHEDIKQTQWKEGNIATNVKEE